MSEAVALFLSQAIEGYLIDFTINHSPETKKVYGPYLKQFLAWQKDVRINEIAPANLSSYMVYLNTEYQVKRVKGSTRGTQLSSSALDNHWKVIRSFFKWCGLNLGIERPDLKLPRPEVVTPEIISFTRDEIKQLLNACEWTKPIERRTTKAYRVKKPCSLRNKAILLLLLDTGVRIGELCRLLPEDIDLSTGTISIKPFYSNRKARPRQIPIGHKVKRLLWQYQVDHVFNGSFFGLVPQNVRLFMWRLEKQTGIKQVHPHRFRHTFAIQFLKNGGNVYSLQYILGHRSLEMVKRYLRLADLDIKAIHEQASPADRWNF